MGLRSRVLSLFLTNASEGRFHADRAFRFSSEIEAQDEVRIETD